MRILLIAVVGAVPSWNIFYSGMPHWKRTDIKNEWFLRVREALDPEVEMFDKPVNIKVFAYYKGNPVDSDNVCDKLLIDGLKGRVIVDDSTQWLYDACTHSYKSDGDYAIIHVAEAEDNDGPPLRPPV